MEYPKYPQGLNKLDHYTMADQVFDACVQAIKAHVPLPSVRAEAPQPARGPLHRKRGGKRIA